MRRILTARAARGLADGFVSVLLAQYLTTLGFSPFEIGAIVTGTLLGSAALTLFFGLAARPVALRSLLLVASVVMVGTGLGFAAASTFWLLMVIAVVGTLNPSAGDVSVFLPTEQAIVATEVQGHTRTAAFAHYGLVGAMAGAFGALLSGVPNRVSKHSGLALVTAQRLGFVFYAAIGAGVFFVYRGLRSASRPSAPRTRGLGSSRRTVLELSALFSFDSAGSGFVVTSILVLWLQLRFDLSPSVTAGVFFAGGLLAGCSQLLAPKLASRIGMVRTMAFTHMPANVALILAAFAPSGAVAIALLLARALVSQLDVPARQAFVMTLVPEEHRPAAASVTNVPRSLASATTPLLAGALLNRSTFGWPLLIAGVMKLTYDVVLLVSYHHVPEVEGASRRLL